MPNILILGSEGFIGHHLVDRFVKSNYDVFGCDLFETAVRKGNYQYMKVSRLSPEWEELFERTKFDYCINAAGSGNVSYSMTHPLADFEANTLDTARILDAIRRFNASCRYVHISSAAVYGNPEKLPIQEDDKKTPVSPYGWNKLMAEQICSEYYHIYGISTAIIRPFSVYGNGLRKQIFWDICAKIAKGDKISLFGTGKESRDFIHINDLSELMLKVVENSNFNNTVYNAGSGTETTIRTIANIFEEKFINKKQIAFSGEVKKGDPINWKADVSRISSLNFHPAVILEKGVGEYIDWYSALANE